MGKRISLVIGSGGIKCAAAIGLWRVLKSENIEVENVVGCSGGSMYAALIANHVDEKSMEEWSM
ncbi:MAG TPA: patatin-like phospholipase family protein, partial [Anaerolineales bacterium]